MNIWVNVTAQSIHQLVEFLLQCTAVQMQLPDAQDKLFMKLLVTVKPLIAGAYTVKQLQSNDIEVSVSDQHTKN